MRVLFSTTAGLGHFGPLAPVARACAAAGHQVAVAAPTTFADVVTQAGFEHLPFPDAPPELMREAFGRVMQLPFLEANHLVLSEVFARLDAQAALPAMNAIVADWRPSLVVREPCEFASLVSAEIAGIPQVQVAIGMGPLSAAYQAVLHEPLAELSLLGGLAADRAAELLVTSPTFTSVPPVLDREDKVDGGDISQLARERGPVWRFRDGMGQRPGIMPPTWGDPSHPLVYVSYGSVTGGMRGLEALYGATLRALADLPVRVLITTGEGLDPASLEPVPGNTRVERWWPQADVMPVASATVGHGGFGTTMTALAAGVPQVVLPLFAFDQSVHAERVAASGAGLQVLGGPDAVADVPAALIRVLNEPQFGEQARRVAADIEALPDVSTCPAVLDELAASPL